MCSPAKTRSSRTAFHAWMCLVLAVVSSGPQFLPFPLETWSVQKQRSQQKIRSLCERIPSRVLDDFLPLGPSPLQKCVTRYKQGRGEGGDLNRRILRLVRGPKMDGEWSDGITRGGRRHSTVFLTRAQTQFCRTNVTKMNTITPKQVNNCLMRKT